MHSLLKDRNDIKIFILHLLSTVGYPLNFVDVNDIIVTDGVVSYFDFVECFSELINSGDIKEVTIDGEARFEITELGISAADSLKTKLPTYIREKSVKSAFRLLSFKKSGTTIKTSTDILKGGSYRFNCKILEKGEPIMDVSVVLDNKAQLDRMNHNFYDRPEVVYRGLFAVLTGEVNYLLDKNDVNL